MSHAAVVRSDYVVNYPERFCAWALALLLVILPINPTVALPLWLPWGEDLGPGELSLSLPPILSLLAVGLWVAGRRMHATPRRISFGPPFLSVPLAALILLSFVSAPFGINPLNSFVSALSYHVLLAAIYLLSINLPVDKRAIVYSLAVGCVVQALVGWPQFLMGHSVGLESLGEKSLNAASAGVSIVMVGQTRLLRAYGLTGHPNQLGGYLIFSIPIMAGYLLSRSKGRIPTALLLIALLIGLATLMATFSRAAWLGLLVGGGAMPILLRGRGVGLSTLPHARLLLAIITIMVTGFVVANWQPILGRLGAESYATEFQSIDERSNLNEVAWQVAQARPVAGVGLGNYVEGVTVLLPERAPDFPGMTVHNVVLLAAAELGVMGALLWLCLMVSPWIALWASKRRRPLAPWSAGLYGALAALAVVSFLDYYLWCTLRGGVMIWLTWGLVAREWNEHC